MAAKVQNRSVHKHAHTLGDGREDVRFSLQSKGKEAKNRLLSGVMQVMIRKLAHNIWLACHSGVLFGARQNPPEERMQILCVFVRAGHPKIGKCEFPSFGERGGNHGDFAQAYLEFKTFLCRICNNIHMNVLNRIHLSRIQEFKTFLCIHQFLGGFISG